MDATSETVTMSAGRLTLELVPALGGSVSAFRTGTTNLMRPLSDGDRAAHNVLGVAMFPMLPYANRIAGNAFTYGGRTYTFASNNLPEKFNVHGVGWHKPWHVISSSLDEVELGLDVLEAQDPYMFSARQTFLLDAKGLTVGLSIINRGLRTMPFGFGIHPWFDRDSDVTLQFIAERFYLEEPDGVSGDPISLPPELGFAEVKQVPAGWRNNNYGGWDGRATIRYPSRGITMSFFAGPRFKNLMLYANPMAPYFCLEPQTNAAGAFNRQGGFESPEEGVFVLAPGEEAEDQVRIDVEALEESA